MEYLKLAPDIDTDPELEDAGWWAARVYELLLKVSALKDRHGRIGPEYQRSSWLARRWNLTPDVLNGTPPERVIEGGIASLKRVGKLSMDGDVLVIVGWDRFYKPAKTNAERQSEHRASRREVTKGNESNEAPLLAVTSNGPVTSALRSNVSNESNATHPPTPPTTQDKDISSQPSVAEPAANAMAGGVAEPKPKREPKPNEWLVLAGECFEIRKAQLPDAVADTSLDTKALIASMHRLATEHGKPAVLAAYRAMVADPWARSCDPPCPMTVFVSEKKFPAFLSAARRQQPSAPRHMTVADARLRDELETQRERARADAMARQSAQAVAHG